MYQVVTDQIGQLKKFFTPLPPANAPMLQAFFDGRAAGRAFVNDFRKPSACVVAMNYRFVFFGGEVSLNFLEESLRHLRKEQTLHVVWPAEKTRATRRPAPDHEAQRIEFAHRDDPDRTRIRVIQRESTALGEIRRIDAALFSRCHWREEVTRALGSPEGFLMHGIGYCMLIDGKIAAETYGCLWTPKRVELAAITLPEFRGRGYAAAVCSHLIDTCEAVGFETYWSSDIENQASLRLAEKLGYDQPHEYRLLRYDHTPAPVPAPA